jgi:hypothetical protein
MLALINEVGPAPPGVPYVNEQTIFTEALARSNPHERAAFLDQACQGDDTLRQRIDRLLAQHQHAGDFLETPAMPEVIEELAGQAFNRPTQAGPAGDDGVNVSLDFLTHSEKPDSLGRLGHYEVQEVIGRGGMGVVLRAFDEELHRVVAIKVMAQPLATNATARKRFKREAQAVAAVSHDHIVTIHAVEEANGLPYLVMQYVAGLSLQQRLDRDGPLQLQEVLRIGMQTAAGLAAAHAQGLVHRDIKPANILLENGVERVRITDFGLARAAVDAVLTQSGMVAGTPQYMSPEQAEGQPIDHRSDLFSLGSVLYAMCAGRPPFRAGTGMGVLKRVCEANPTPVRETNPEVPDWLAELIARLHARDPAGRFQTAAEVAELLGRHLAHVQHPSVVPHPAAARPGDETTPARPPASGKRWAVAAGVLVAAIAVLGTTEATGVTNVRAAIIRLFTPGGTLVVETNDPGVQVTVEGDGDLVITGTGPQEVRLKAGNYRVRATRDGKPVKLDRDLVTISRERPIVRVRLEDATPAAAAPEAGTGAFVLLGGKGVKPRGFDTLAEAVQSAGDGDTIEIRGDGPFVIPQVPIGKKALTIRAGTGFRPVIKRNADPPGEDGRYLMHTQGPLVLEGLELHMTGPGGDVAVYSEPRNLHVANCRFVLHGGHALSSGTPATTVRNCEFVSAGDSFHVFLQFAQNGTVILENNCFGNPFSHAISFAWAPLDKARVAIHLKRNTVLGLTGFHQSLSFGPDAGWPGAAADEAPAQIDVSENVFDATDATFRALSVLTGPEWLHKDARPMSAEEARRLLLRVMTWREQRNLYCNDLTFLTIRQKKKNPRNPNLDFTDEPMPGCHTLADWKRTWKAGDSGSTQGVIRYQADDMFDKMVSTRITPADFRLRRDSAGYRASKDGKDLGADVELVGPGPAYERWKKTPEYQEWDPSDHGRWLQAAVLHAARGDVEGYRRTCREMIHRFGHTDQWLIAENTAISCLLLPDAVSPADFDRVQELAERNITGTEKVWGYRFLLRTKGLADYRAGRYAEAVKWLEQFAPNANGNHQDAMVFAILSMVRHRQAQAEAAAVALARAEALVAKEFNPAKGLPSPANDWRGPVMAWLLCREAEELLKKESGVNNQESGKKPN